MLPGLGQLGASPNWAHFLEGSPAGPKSLPCAFQYESKSRMSAEAALSHPYFQSLGERVHQLDDSKYPRDRGQNKGKGQWVWVGLSQGLDPWGPGEWSWTHGFPFPILIWRTES